MNNSNFEDTYKYAIRLLKLRIRSEKELRQKLLDKKFNKDSIEKVIEKLKITGLIDDKKFVEFYINSQIKKIKSIKLVIKKLEEEFKIDKNILENINIQEFKKKLFGYTIQKIKKKYKTLDFLKIQNFLLSKGFDYSEIEEIIGVLKNEKSIDYWS